MLRVHMTAQRSLDRQPSKAGCLQATTDSSLRPEAHCAQLLRGPSLLVFAAAEILLAIRYSKRYPYP